MGESLGLGVVGSRMKLPVWDGRLATSKKCGILTHTVGTLENMYRAESGKERVNCIRKSGCREREHLNPWILPAHESPIDGCKFVPFLYRWMQICATS
jgi:hypothetical protein